MAKGNMLLGHARGSVGDITFRRANGAQITSAKATIVKNPKTYGQALQRAIFTTIMKASVLFKAIIDHSFQSRAVPTESIREFIRLNIDKFRSDYLNWIPSEADPDAPNWVDNVSLAFKGGEAVLGKYLISKGSLPSFNAQVTTLNGANAIWCDALNVLEFTMGGDTADVFYNNNTVAKVLELNSWLKPKDQITVVAAYLVDGSVRFAYDRVVLNISDGMETLPFFVSAPQEIQDIYGEKTAVINPALLSAETTFDNAIILHESDNSLVYHTIGLTRDQIIDDATDGDAIVNGALIQSRYEEGVWRRSTEVLAGSAYPFNGAAAVESYMTSTTEVSSDLYLNQADANVAETAKTKAIQAIVMNGAEVKEGQSINWVAGQRFTVYVNGDAVPTVTVAGVALDYETYAPGSNSFTYKPTGTGAVAVSLGGETVNFILRAVVEP